MPALRLEYRDPATLADNGRNWRKHPQRQLDALADVIAEVGWAGALLYNEQLERLVDGHARKKLPSNGSPVPVLIGSWTEAEEAKILATLDPLAAMAEADSAALEAVLADVRTDSAALTAMLADLAKSAGLAGPKPGLTDPDDIPEPPEEPVTQPGDLWLLGDHRLLCGDATNAGDVARVLDGERADALITDPPYGISIVKVHGNGVAANPGHAIPFGAAAIGGAKAFGSKNDRRDLRGTVGVAKIAPVNYYRPIAGDDTPFDPAHLLGLAPVVVLWGANYFADKLPPSAGWVCWDKREGDMGRNTFAECELAWTNQDKPALIFRHLWMGLHKGSERGERRVHPTQKPVALYDWLLETYTMSGQLVLDPYAGSGSAVIAAEQLGRRCYGLEIEPAYCDVIVRRWEAFTGRTAERVPAAVDSLDT